MTEEPPSFVLRLRLALRILADAVFAAKVRELARTPLELGSPARPPEPNEPKRAEGDRALSLLALLQREGRLVDFIQQDIASAEDAAIGAAARIVHEGCRNVLRGHFDLLRVRDEPEGATVTVPPGFDGRAVTLTGNVRGAPPYRGVLRHAGWRATSTRLPEPAPGHDPTVVAPAEIEL